MTLTIILPLLAQYFLTLKYMSCYGNIAIGNGLYNSGFWLVVVFPDDLCYEDEFLIGGENYTHMCV